MASIIQQHPQQSSTESFACQKEKSGCWQLYPVRSILFFLPYFRAPFNRLNKINGGISFRHHGHNAGQCDRSNSNVWRGGKRYQDTYHTHLW